MTEELNQELQTEEFTDNIENAPVTEQDVTKTVDDTEKIDTETIPSVSNEFLKIKYNKEEKILTEDEAREYAQKGMNYDHIKSELDKVRNSKATKMLEKYARANNMTIDEYADYLEQAQELEEIRTLAESNNISEELAKRLYELEKKENERQQADKMKKEEEQIEKTARECFSKLAGYFKKEYGRDIDVEKDIPNEVFALQDEYQVPVHIAFQLYETRKLKNELKIKNKNAENAEASVGSITAEGMGDIEEFSQERVDKMSAQEMAKYMDNPKFRKAIGI